MRDSAWQGVAGLSGPLGVAQEIVASSKMIVEAIKAESGNALIDAVVADYQQKVEDKGKLEPPPMSKDPD